MEPSKMPPGWNEERVRNVLTHYEEQTEDEAVAEDEAAFEERSQTRVHVARHHGEAKPPGLKSMQVTTMTKALKEVFEEAAKLPGDKQDTLASILRRELDGDARWEELFNDPRSDVLLKQLADEALEEHRRGETLPLDPETL